MSLRTLLIVWFCFAAHGLVAQPDAPIAFTLQTRIPARARELETDRLGFIFAVSPTNQLLKFSKAGKALATLNYAYQGKIQSIDPGNPFEVYLFYRELNKVAFLDNNLALRGSIDLAENGIVQSAAIARAYDNSLWVFDNADQMLKKVKKDASGFVQTSGNILQYLPAEPVAPVEIADNGKQVFLNDTLHGILVFDAFCSYQKMIPLKGARHIRVLDNDLYFVKHDSIFRYNLVSMTTVAAALPDSQNILDACIERGALYLLKEDEIRVYSF